MFKVFVSKKMAKRLAIGLASAGTVTSLGVALALNMDLMASDAGAHLATYPWFHEGMFNTFDHASVRRGFEVYKQVCSACHSMKYTYYRHLVGVSHTEAEAKQEAAEIMVTDGPNDEGNMFQRPGKLSDHLPSPYPNEEAAKAANNGALPPDLSLIAFARKNGTNYLYSLLTGYHDPPAGVEPKEGLHYNPYFAGGWIAMAKALYDDVIEYTDGTAASTSQLAKDVTEFLRWSAEKSHDEKKKLLLKVFLVFPPILGLFYIYKRRVFTVLKSRKIVYNPTKSPGKSGH
jgi:ubiquinol-cytochrome c reductase cytochrome c1 subunit